MAVAAVLQFVAVAAPAPATTTVNAPWWQLVLSSIGGGAITGMVTLAGTWYSQRSQHQEAIEAHKRQTNDVIAAHKRQIEDDTLARMREAYADVLTQLARCRNEIEDVLVYGVQHDTKDEDKVTLDKEEQRDRELRDHVAYLLGENVVVLTMAAYRAQLEKRDEDFAKVCLEAEDVIRQFKGFLRYEVTWGQLTAVGEELTRIAADAAKRAEGAISRALGT